jgi:serine protease AprX
VSENSIPPNWVPVTIRLKVPATTLGVEVFRFIEDWNHRLQPYLTFDREYSPVQVTPPRAEREEFREGGMQLVVVRAWVDPQLLVDPELIRLVKEQPHFNNVARDAPLQPFERDLGAAELSAAPGGASPRVECAGSDRGFGTAADVAKKLGVTRIWAAGYTGRGLVVGVVDGGITAYGRSTQLGAWPAIPQPPAEGEVIGGYPLADWGTTAEGWGEHGNMIAFDVQAMAPEARLWDIRIFEPGVAFPSYVMNALAGYQLAIDHYRTHGVPQILVNSWGLYDSATDPDYASNPTSDIALAVEGALDAGILVLFAAGNCGDGCLFTSGSLCGFGNRGPGASILGPNGHPEVMTVGAATSRGEWCGYTSQGPAVLPPNDPDKPDFCSFSQFEGFFPNQSELRPYDGGTSAANGIAAGVVALLKQVRPDLTQEECKRLLRETAQPIRTPAAHDGAGAGIIDALRAFRSL